MRWLSGIDLRKCSRSFTYNTEALKVWLIICRDTAKLSKLL